MPSSKGSSQADGKPIAFAGPSLAGVGHDRSPASAPAEERRRWKRLEGLFDVRPPARRGDLLAALSDRPAAIAVLDGYYYTVPSIAHKEILFALDQGVPIYGGASFGALRAAECAPWGMQPVGWVAERYIDGTIEGDDEVALLHLDSEDGYRAVTVALVEVRYALDRIVKADPSLSSSAALVLEHLASLPFDERRRPAVERSLKENLGANAANDVLHWLDHHSIKRRDALETLELATGELTAGLSGKLAGRPAATKSPTPNTPAVEPTVFLGAFLERHLTASTETTGRSLPIDLAWRAARVLHPEAPRFVAAVRQRYRQARRADPETIQHRLIEAMTTDLGSLPGARWLPPTELTAEATLRALAQLADRADRPVSDDRPGPADEPSSHDESIDQAIDPVPGWILQRAFVLSPAFDRSVAVAVACEEVFHAFEAWTQGDRRITRRALERLASELWQCHRREVAGQAQARGLRQTTGLSVGFEEALAWLAPAERLGRPINGYPTLRDKLLQETMV